MPLVGTEEDVFLVLCRVRFFGLLTFTKSVKCIMAKLIDCSACGNKFSPDVDACPKCGQMKTSAKVFSYIFGGILLVFVVIMFYWRARELGLIGR